MKRIINAIFFILGFHLFLSAQMSNMIWYFGQNAGLDFNAIPPMPLEGQLNTNEGCATICDPAGQLLFYTDGRSVWNRQHQLMPNGSGMLGGSSSTQAALIVQEPGSYSRYYIFYMEDHEADGDFYYSIVDMCMDNGSGDILNAEKNRLITKNVCEKAIAIPHLNGHDVWILTHRFGSNEYLTYRLDPYEISSNPVVSATGSTYSMAAVIGPVKASHDGKKIVSAASFHSVCEMFDFDPGTGFVTNPVNLRPLLTAQSFVYGIEFSPKDRFLYLSTFWVTNSLYQIDLNTMSVTTLHSLPGNYLFGALQTGPDGKIYMARGNENFLGVIPEPDKAGFACNYIEQGQDLASGTFSGLGLPNVSPPQLFHQDAPDVYSIRDTVICPGDSILLTPGQPEICHPYYVWNVGKTSKVITVYEAGTYWVKIGNTCSHSIDTIKISSINSPEITFQDTTICIGQRLALDVSGTGTTYLWSDMSTSPILFVDEPGTYAVTVTNVCGSTEASIDVEGFDCDFKVFMPNIFSPNDDGINDGIGPSITEPLQKYALKIFDRWGNEVFETNDYLQTWDGSFIGKHAPAGVYAYKLEAVSMYGVQKRLNGNITLLR